LLSQKSEAGLSVERVAGELIGAAAEPLGNPEKRSDKTCSNARPKSLRPDQGRYLGMDGAKMLRFNGFAKFRLCLFDLLLPVFLY
jgi:hypothetical protein